MREPLERGRRHKDRHRDLPAEQNGRRRDLADVDEHARTKLPAEKRLHVVTERHLVAGATREVPERPRLEQALGFELVVADVEQHHSGRRTCSVSSSTLTEPPSARTSNAATAAPRSRRSSPSTTGADAGVIGAIVNSGPAAVTSTSSTPPCRRAHCAWAVTARCVASRSTRTAPPSPLTLTRSSPSAAAASRASSSVSASRRFGW